MLRKEFREILSQYVKLPFIVYEKQYLVPQRPFLPKWNNLIGKNGNILGSFQTNLPELVDKELIKRANDPSQHSELIELYKQEWKRKRKEFDIELEDYKKKYVHVLKTPRVVPALSFYSHNRQRLMEELKQKKLRFNFKILNQVFKSQPKAVQQKYAEIAAEQCRIKIQARKQYEQDYKIPDIKVIRPNVLYSMENEKTVSAEQFKNLDIEAQNTYKKKAETLRQGKEAKLLKFIKERGITLNEFNQICKICTKMEKLKKLMRKQLREARQSKQEGAVQDDFFSENEKSENVDLQQQQRLDVSNSPKQILQDQRMTKVQKEEQQSGEDEGEEMSFKGNASLDLKEALEQFDNLDFQEEEIDVFELKRMADLKKKQKKL